MYETRQCTYNGTLKRDGATTVAGLHIVTVFVALFIQHAMRMRHIVM